MGNVKARRAAWWSRSRGLPSVIAESWKASLAAQPGRSARILAWATTPVGFCIASPAALSYGSEDGWEHIGWHEIERGGWNAELRTLSWVLYVGPGQAALRGSLELIEPGRMPELFRNAFPQRSPLRSSSRCPASGASPLRHGVILAALVPCPGMAR